MEYCKRWRMLEASMSVHNTPVTYSAPEVTAIRAQIAAGDPPTCPRCGVHLVEADAPNPDVRILFEAYCPRCRHCLFLRQLPEEH